MLGLAVQAWVLVPLFTGGGEERRSDLTVMTSNLQFGRGDTTAVVRVVAAEDVDVLVLEEVTPAGLAGLLDAGLAELLPHRRGKPVVTAAGTMVFSRYPLTTPRPLRARQRRSRRPGGCSRPVPAAGSPRVLSVAAAAAVGGRPGDGARPYGDRGRRRARPWWWATSTRPTTTYRCATVLDAGVRDAAEEAGSGWQPTWPTTRYGQDWLRPLLTIDHVLTSAHFEAVHTHTVEIPRTDHLALVAKLRPDPL